MSIVCIIWKCFYGVTFWNFGVFGVIMFRWIDVFSYFIRWSWNFSIICVKLVWVIFSCDIIFFFVFIIIFFCVSSRFMGFWRVEKFFLVFFFGGVCRIKIVICSEIVIILRFVWKGSIYIEIIRCIWFIWSCKFRVIVKLFFRICSVVSNI